MTNFKVTMVDVNDVPFDFMVKADLPEDAAGMAEDDNRYCRSVSVAQLVLRPGMEVEQWESVYVPNDDDMDPDYEDGMTDVEADADTLRCCGWGTDEDYGYYGDGEY